MVGYTWSMKDISSNIKKAFDLSYIEYTEERARNVEIILSFIAQIADMSSVYTEKKVERNIVRVDTQTVVEGLYTEVVLENAPRKIGKHIFIPPVL